MQGCISFIYLLLDLCLEHLNPCSTGSDLSRDMWHNYIVFFLHGIFRTIGFNPLLDPKLNL